MSTVPFTRTRNQTFTDKSLPNNLDAERSVLGAILLDNDAIKTVVREHLNAHDFFLDQHKRIYLAMLELAAAQKPIDLITLTEHLHQKTILESAGGAPYLASLADGMPKVSNVGHYARIVLDKAVRRNVIHLTHNLQQRAFEESENPTELLQNAESDIKELWVPKDDQRLVAVDILDFLTMKLDPIDFMFEPILPVNNSAMIWALTGAGKTYVMLYMAYCLAIGAPQCFVWDIPKRRPVTYVDGEMDELTLQERMQEISRGFMTDLGLPERGFFKVITPDQQPKNPPRINSKEGRARIEEYLTEGSLLVLDNLSALSPGADEKETEDWATQQEWILHLRRHKVGTFVVHHGNASGQKQFGSSKKEHQLSCNLRLSTSSEWTAEDGLRVKAQLDKLRRRGKDGRWKPQWGQPFEITLRTDNGIATFSHRPMKQLLRKRALEMLLAGMRENDVAQDTGLNRFQIYRLKQKLKADGADAAVADD